jgi:hypothetical protein
MTVLASTTATRSNLDDRDVRIVCRQWALAEKGWHGAQGGWIYTDQGRPIMQGWGSVWHLFRRQIADWLTRQETAFPSFNFMVSETAATYRPTLSRANARNRILADLYDQAQRDRNDRRRAHRIGRLA